MPSRLCPVVLLAALALLAVSAPARLRGQEPAGTSPEVRALWVVRDSLSSPASIEQLVKQAAAHGFNTLLVQVRGRGDAYYTGGLEPRAEALATQPASFDPLAETLRLARAAGIAVHAWVNVSLVASATWLPSSRDHVASRHPEWLMLPRALAQELSAMPPQGPGYVGKLARWTRAAGDIEGLFLSPIVPDAAAHTVAVVADLARRYPIDGVHFDYLRYPGQEFDHGRLALQEFARTIAPTLPAAERRTLAARADGDVLAWVDAYPERWADFRRSRLTALAMRLRTAVLGARPTAVISAAVYPDAETAFASKLQDWRVWAAGGLIDVVCPMAYTTDGRAFRTQIDEAVRLTPPAQVWAGIGSYRLPPSQTIAHIDIARAAGARGIVLFSYDALTSGASDGYLETIRRTAFTSAPTGQDNQR